MARSADLVGVLGFAALVVVVVMAALVAVDVGVSAAFAGV